MGRKRNESLRDAIREGYLAGKTCAEIAAATGSSRGSVKVIANSMGLRHPFAVEKPYVVNNKGGRWSHLDVRPID